MTATGDRPGYAGIALYSGGNRLENHGAVMSRASAVVMASGPSGTSNVVINHGTITSTGGDGIEVSSGTGQISNWGVISGARFGVWLRSGGSTLTNFGTITGLQGNAVHGGFGTDIITNRGTLNGAVSLDSGNDVFDGRGGIVTGGIYGGNDNDLFILDDQGTVADGGAGTDTIRAYVDYDLGNWGIEVLDLAGDALNGSGNEAANTITGTFRANILLGQGGADTLHGRAGDDTLRGETADDVLQGDDGNDLLRGGSGNDSLTGGEGDDALFGGIGNDTISGNGGADIMTGNGGADRFVFTAISDSDPLERDTITQFTRGQDKIDLSGIDALVAAGDQAFVFRGANAFSGVGQARIRDLGADVLVELNLSGSRAPEFALLIKGVGTLAATDFIL